MPMEDDAFNPLANYEQVEQFDSDLEEEYEEEEPQTLYVTLDLGQLDPNLLPNATSYKLIVGSPPLNRLRITNRLGKGLETPHPFLQIGGSIFKGDYETLLGTEIILQDPPQVAGSLSASRMLQPLATTSNRIRFREVDLVPKTFPGDTHGAGEDEENNNVNLRIEEAQSKTLGGVSRERRATFFPIASKEKGGIPSQLKGKRRWHKRPEGYHTSDEEKGEKPPAPHEGPDEMERHRKAKDGNGSADQDDEEMEIRIEDGNEL